jgi:hypothetical protein
VSETPGSATDATDATDATHSTNRDVINEEESKKTDETKVGTISSNAICLYNQYNPIVLYTKVNVMSIARSINTISKNLVQKEDTESDAIIVHTNRDTYTRNKSDNNGNNTGNANGNNYKLATMCLSSTFTTDEERVSPFSTSVASVASVADLRDNASDIKSTASNLARKSKTEVLMLPALPCVWCGYKDPIEFDLGNHLQIINRNY